MCRHQWHASRPGPSGTALPERRRPALHKPTIEVEPGRSIAAGQRCAQRLAGAVETEGLDHRRADNPLLEFEWVIQEPPDGDARQVRPDFLRPGIGPARRELAGLDPIPINLQ